MLMRAGKTIILYLGVLVRLVGIFAILVFAGCGDRGGGYIIEPGAGEPGPVGDTTPPAVLSISPGANSTGNPINTAIIVTFSEPLAPATITATTFQVKENGGQFISGNLNVSGSSTTFTPVGWLSINATYTVILSTSITDLAGNHLTSALQWTFTTNSRVDPVPPTIIAQSPSNAQTGVVLTSAITVTFSEPVDPATITVSNATLFQTGNIPVGVTFTLSNSTLVMTPTSTLKYRTTYSVCITTGVTDLAGNPLTSDNCWSFTTVENSGLFKPYEAIPTGSNPEAVAVGDVTGDGKNDVVLVTSFYFDPTNDYHVFLFAQDAQGNLATAVTCTTMGSYGNRPMSVAIGDINNDGKNEIVVGLDRSRIEVFSYNGNGTLSSVATYLSLETSLIRIADLNHDGLLDVVGIGWGSDKAAVFLQNSGGTLDPPVLYSITHAGWDDLEVGDVNNDGLTDIIVMSGQGFGPNIGVLVQKSTGTYDPAVYYDLGGNELAGGVAVGDVNSDGLADIILSTWAVSPSELAVFAQNPGGTLNAPKLYALGSGATAVEVADVNGDGRKDIAIRSEPVGICLQTDNGLIAECEYYNVPSASGNRHGMAIGDINSDGLPDIVIADIWQGLVVLYHK